MEIDATDRKIIVATQAGLPLVERPYHAIAGKIGLEPEEVMARIKGMLDAGVIRRIGAAPNHYALGLNANGMSVWDVDDSQIGDLGARVGQLGFVTHCYRRPRALPLWPYNLFAMVHGRTRAEVEEKVQIVADVLGSAARASDVLYSTRILKKTGLRLSE